MLHGYYKVARKNLSWEKVYENYTKQAGTELGQAQLQLELGFTLIKMCCITLMITN